MHAGETMHCKPCYKYLESILSWWCQVEFGEFPTGGLDYQDMIVSFGKLCIVSTQPMGKCTKYSVMIMGIPMI